MERIEILNWNDYLPRKGIARPSWFSFPVKFFMDPEYMGRLDSETIATLSYLCAQGTRSNGFVTVNFVHASAYLGLTADLIEKKIRKLEQLQLVRVDVTDTSHARTEPKTLPYGEDKEDKEDRTGERERECTYHEEHESSSPADAGEPPPLPKIIRLWNQHADQKLSRVKLASPSRRKHSANRWKEHPSDEFWTDVIWKINRSEFCLGKNARGWKADIDFLLRPDTAAKVLEGKYDGGSQPGEKEPRKKTWYEEQSELQRKGLPNQLDGTLPVGGGQ